MPFRRILPGALRAGRVRTAHGISRSEKATRQAEKNNVQSQFGNGRGGSALHRGDHVGNARRGARSSERRLRLFQSRLRYRLDLRARQGPQEDGGDPRRQRAGQNRRERRLRTRLAPGHPPACGRRKRSDLHDLRSASWIRPWKPPSSSPTSSSCISTATSSGTTWRPTRCRYYEPSYLAGIVAGAMTESDTIGYVSSFPLPAVLRIINRLRPRRAERQAGREGQGHRGQFLVRSRS